jgi:hypothetical protein
LRVRHGLARLDERELRLRRLLAEGEAAARLYIRRRGLLHMRLGGMISGCRMRREGVLGDGTQRRRCRSRG